MLQIGKAHLKEPLVFNYDHYEFDIVQIAFCVSAFHLSHRLASRYVTL